jgi:dipeptidyl aminopeptidase/acylaminoacyl peptidase
MKPIDQNRLIKGQVLALLVGVVALTLAACAPLADTTLAPVVEEPSEAISAGDSQPEEMPTALPSATAAPSATPTSSPTPTPTHPLMIEEMRRQSYPGSEIEIEQVLESGANYTRRIVSYQSEGNRIYALLTVPFGERPESGWPVIVFNHGFIPPNVYRTTERYVAYVDNLARSGYIVLRPDYRGHGSSEGVARGGYSNPDYTVDVLNAVASIKRYPDADPNRIGMWGHSMGGQITLRAMVVSPDIKVGVIWGGVVGSYPDLINVWWLPREAQRGPTPTPDPANPLAPRRGRWRSEMYETYGSPEENPEFWAAISPNSYLDDLSGPIQLHHGLADHSVPPALSEILYSELLAVGIPTELYEYEGDDHDITTHFTLAMQRSIAFFDTYLK